MNKALLLSIKPKYAQAILNGTKTVEVRRKFPTIEPGTIVVLYSSSPERAIVGSARVKTSSQVETLEVWHSYSESIGIGKNDLDRYLEGVEISTLLGLESPEKFVRPLQLEDLRLILDIEPAQSFRYLNESQVNQILKVTS